MPTPMFVFARFATLLKIAAPLAGCLNHFNLVRLFLNPGCEVEGDAEAWVAQLLYASSSSLKR